VAYSEIASLIYQVEGEAALRKANEALEKQREAMDKVIASKKKYTGQGYVQAIEAEARALKPLIANVDELSRRFGGGTSAAAKAQGVQQLGYAIQDFTSTSGNLAQKLNSVTNNIQQLAVAFLPSGWAFVGVTGAMAALQTLFNNSEAIANWFSDVDPKKLEAQAKKVKELEAKSKTLESSLEKIRKAEGKTPWTEESGAVASEAIKGAGGVDKVRARLADQYASESATMGGAQKALRDAAGESDAANKALAATPAADWKAMDAARSRKAAADKALSDAQARVAKARADAETKADETVVGATEGDTKSVYEMAKRFGGVFNQATPDSIRAADREAAASMAETETTAAAREGRRRRDRTINRAEARRGRLASNELDDQQNARGTPAEERLSAAITYLESNLNKLAPGLKLTNEEIVKAGEALVRLRDVDKVGPTEAPAAAVRPFVEARRGVQGDVQLDEIRNRLNVDTEGQLSEDQLNGVARETQNLMRQGVAPMEAAQQAINELLMANQALMQQLTMMQSGFTQQAQQARFQGQQAQALSGRMSGLMGGGAVPVMQPNVWGF
jgi:hypothetical protein